MDIIDHADEMMEQLTTARIAEIRSVRPGLIATGRCHNCDETLPPAVNATQSVKGVCMQVNWKEVCQCAGYKSLKAAYISAGDLS